MERLRQQEDQDFVSDIDQGQHQQWHQFEDGYCVDEDAVSGVVVCQMQEREDARFCCCKSDCCGCRQSRDDGGSGQWVGVKVGT